MAARLRNHSRAGIHQDDGKVGSRTAGDHIAGVLFVSRSVGNDELTVIRTEIAVGHIDGDPLFAFGFQAVQQQSVVDMVAGIPHALAVAFEGIQLVFV